MRHRPLLTAALAGIALTVAAAPAGAGTKTTERLDRSIFDGAPEVTASSLHLSGPTAGPLGGALDLTVTAADGTLPTAPGACDAADVTAVLTVSPGEELTISTTGEVCRHQFGSTLILNAYFDNRDVAYSGTQYERVKVVGDGLIAASDGIGLGYGASVATTVRW